MPDEPTEETIADIEREFQARLANLHKSAKDDTSLLPDEEVDRRLESMDERTRTAGQVQMPTPPELEYKRRNFAQDSSDKGGYRGLGIGLSAAYALVGMMIFGVGIGWLIDHGPQSSNVGPAFGGLAGCVIGIVFVLWLINRENK